MKSQLECWRQLELLVAFIILSLSQSLRCVFPTYSFTGSSIRLKKVTLWAVAPEASSLIVALLAAESWYQALIDILTGFRVIKKLIAWWTAALSSKRSLRADVAAASIVQYAVILVFMKLGNMSQ